ncbi:unnamed protein product [Choristocarpus tenellus]
MTTAKDYVICEVKNSEDSECIDRSSVSSREVPGIDLEGDPYLRVSGTSIVGDWTGISFDRSTEGDDDSDYNLLSDIDAGVDTNIIVAWRSGSGIGQHPNSQRLIASLNFATGEARLSCDDDTEYYALHGALLLIAWLILVPLGFYFVRYRKGSEIRGTPWYEAHAEAMIIASEAVIPLGVTAIAASSGGGHNSPHAHLGYFMISAVVLQLFTGWLRTRALEAKNANFSIFHRVNKYVHIWSGRAAILAGFVQCGRGLSLVSAEDSLIFEAVDLGFELGSFGLVQRLIFPIWMGFLAFLFLIFEIRKQMQKYHRKGKTSCGCMNPNYSPNESQNSMGMDRLMPRTDEVPIYTTTEFNEKVLNGRRWIIVDGAVIDVSSFAQRHPGGARLILNAVGTDVTSEILGEQDSLGNMGLFPPNRHSEEAIEILKTLVVGYMDEDDMLEEEEKEESDRSEVPMMMPSDMRSAALVRLSYSLLAILMYRLYFRPLSKKGSFFNDFFSLYPGGGVHGRNMDHLASTARRLNILATIHHHLAKKRSTHPTSTNFDGTNAANESKLMDTTLAEHDPLPRKTSNKRILNLFHICPLLMRVRVDKSNRPVYSYIFSCPGKAQALVEAVRGVCYFNMRITRASGQVVQRSYNAFAVRVQHGRGGESGKVAHASETEEGELCVEMRIRLYADGSMSNLLEKLANDPDNAVVQLQGPFMVSKLIPPPVHTRVVMVAAGTGVNPMVQVIRDYIMR